jgi:signal transduction histidine kinase
MRSLVTVPVQAGDFEARLFLLDIPNASFDDFPAAEIVAGRLKALFEQEGLLRQLRRAAAVEERVRIARDLHDGVLQSLAGTALQLSSVVPLVGHSPLEAAARLVAIQEALAVEQRELRSFIRALGPGADDLVQGEVGLVPHLDFVAERLRRHWGLELRCEVTPPEARLGAGLVYDLGQIITEATANAVRHGGAKTVAAVVTADGGAVVVEVADDGRGFPFIGCLDGEELDARGLSPRSLRERASSHGGRLSVESGPAGTRVRVVIPGAPEQRA